MQALRGNTSATNLPSLYAEEPRVEDNLTHDLDLDDDRTGSGGDNDADAKESNEEDEEK